jgi:transcriptional regulator with XRE-family HTH domain
MKAAARVAVNLRRYRVEKGISQENLAVDADIDRSYMSRLERGLENPTIGVLERIVEVLEIDLSTLLQRPSPSDCRPLNIPGGRKKEALAYDPWFVFIMKAARSVIRYLRISGWRLVRCYGRGRPFPWRQPPCWH